MSGPREFELKLEFEPEKAQSLKRHPAVARLGSDAHTETLTSVYFDTDDQRLFGAGVFLRVRRVGDRHIQTIKTVTPGHLFSRGEWEQEIEGPSPDLGQAKDSALGSLSDRDLGKMLKPVFETRVERRISRLQWGNGHLQLSTFQGLLCLRELAQKNVEQARAAYGQFMDAMAQAMSAWSSASSDTVTSAFKAVQDGAIRFAKENAEAGFALANELTKAKDLQDVLRLQSSFAQKQMQSYARQAQELGRLMAEATRSASPKS